MGRNTRPRPRRLAKKLRQIRTGLGLTQAEMVERLRFGGIYQGHVSEYERGVQEPPLSGAAEVCETLWIVNGCINR